MEEWDTSKENFAPVRAGRNAKALREVPLTPSKATLGDIEDRQRWEMAWRGVLFGAFCLVMCVCAARTVSTAENSSDCLHPNCKQQEVPG